MVGTSAVVKNCDMPEEMMKGTPQPRSPAAANLALGVNCCRALACFFLTRHHPCHSHLQNAEALEFTIEAQQVYNTDKEVAQAVRNKFVAKVTACLGLGLRRLGLGLHRLHLGLRRFGLGLRLRMGRLRLHLSHCLLGRLPNRPELLRPSAPSAPGAARLPAERKPSSPRASDAFAARGLRRQYNGVWHCIIGPQFGAYTTYEEKHFCYFYVGQNALLLFKTG